MQAGIPAGGQFQAFRKIHEVSSVPWHLFTADYLLWNYEMDGCGGIEQTNLPSSLPLTWLSSYVHALKCL